MGEILDVLDRRWRNACKIVFKEDIGAMADYVPWLCELIQPNIHRKSSISGKGVAYTNREYAEGSKWVSFDEIDFGRKFAPLSINEVKDIDSLVAAVSERAYYSGNIILGNSGHIEKSTSINDSFFMHETAHLGDCKYLAHCTLGRLCEDCFGTHAPGESQFCIRCTQTYRAKRCFELWMSQNCADCYYVFDLQNCSDCIFCFNMKSRRHCIGNLELEPSKYSKLKGKLLAEMVGSLRKERRLPSLLQIVEGSRMEVPKIKPAQMDEDVDADAVKLGIEREFSKTTKLVLGRELHGIDDYGNWLTRHVHKIEEAASVISGKRLLLVPFIIAVPHLPESRMVTMEEARVLGEAVKMAPAEVESLTLQNVHETIGKIAYFDVEFREGANPNLLECTMSVDANNCYRSSGTVYAKYCAYCMWPRGSSHSFGFDTLFDSSFVINAYYSLKLNRCFEMDSCRDCSDSYFCHNCENVRDSMFCFNAKNLNRAIGNAPLPIDKYKSVKSMLLEQICSELLEKKDLKWDIFNIGMGRKGNQV